MHPWGVVPSLDILLTEKPTPQARPRFIPQLNRVYDPQNRIKANTRNLILQQIQLLRDYMPGVLIPIGKQPIELKVTFFTSFPKSRKKSETEDRDIQNKDIDNYLKYLLDCLQPHFIADDCCIWKVNCEKRHCSDPRTEVTITW